MSPILKKLFFIFVLSMFVLMIAKPVYGAFVQPCGGPEEPECTISMFVQMIVNIITWLWSFVAVLALVFIIVGGFMYIFSAGNPELMARAKNILTWAILGFVISVCAVLIVNMVMKALGYQESWRIITL